MKEQSKCGLCGEPMPPGEEMFAYHGFSGPCPKAPLPKRNSPLEDVLEERKRQDQKWGVQNHPNLFWLGILSEEVGEAAKALIEGKLDELYKELIQVTAVGLAWLECIKRRKEHPPCAACDRGDYSLGHSEECKQKGGEG